MHLFVGKDEIKLIGSIRTWSYNRFIVISITNLIFLSVFFYAAALNLSKVCLWIISRKFTVTIYLSFGFLLRFRNICRVRKENIVWKCHKNDVSLIFFYLIPFLLTELTPDKSAFLQQTLIQILFSSSWLVQNNLHSLSFYILWS